MSTPLAHGAITVTGDEEAPVTREGIAEMFVVDVVRGAIGWDGAYPSLRDTLDTKWIREVLARQPSPWPMLAPAARPEFDPWGFARLPVEFDMHADERGIPYSTTAPELKPEPEVMRGFSYTNAYIDEAWELEGQAGKRAPRWLVRWWRVTDSVREWLSR